MEQYIETKVTCGWLRR